MENDFALMTIDECIAAGMGRSANVGGFSTGKVGGGAGTILVADQPEFLCSVPAGHVIRPFYISVQVQTGVTTADDDEAEILVAVDSLGFCRDQGTSTIVYPSNLRSDIDKGSACTVLQACTAAITTTPGYAVAAAAAPVLDMELDRAVQTANFGDATGISEPQLKVKYEPRHPPFLAGPCTLLIFWGGTIATVGGFAQVQWVEGRIREMLPPI